MKTAKIANFFHDKPLFGLDIGHGSLKVMQVDQPLTKVASPHARPKLLGYGFATFDKAAQDNGVVIRPEVIAQAAKQLFEKQLIGDINTRRVSLAIPAYRTFTRSLNLPKLGPKELRESVELEAEQYISLPLDQLYLDYEVVKETPEGLDVFLVAVPRDIVDSYLELTQIMGLETVLIEPTLSSAGRLFMVDPQSDVASIIIDF